MKRSLSKVVKMISEATSVRVNMEVYDLERKGADVIVLSLGESFFKLPLFSFRAIPKWERGFHYSSSFGLPELREKISNYYRDRYGVASDPEHEVLISAGSKIVIYMALHAVLDPGDEVIIFEPAWVSYIEQVRSCYGVPIMIPYSDDIRDLKKYFTKKTRVIIINNPNNPSGKVYSKNELQALFDFAEKRDCYIISDEAYSDFVLEEPFLSMGRFDKKKRRVMIVNSLSKNLGMSGWRIGYIIADKHLIRHVLKLNQHLITCPATLIEQYLAKYLPKILSHTKSQIQAVVRKRREIQAYMDSIGLEYLPGTGTFYFMVSIESSKLRSEAFARRLLEQYRVAVVPGVGYGKSVDAFLRVGVGTESVARIRRGLLSIRQLIRETS